MNNTRAAHVANAALSAACYGLLGIVTVFAPVAVGVMAALLVAGGRNPWGLAVAIVVTVALVPSWTGVIVTTVWWVKTGVWSWRPVWRRRSL